MKPDLTDLRLFLSIIDTGSITQGAVQANLALASASERLRNIEDSAGVQLLERHSRGVVPTEAGEALAHHARIMLRQREMMQSELQSFAAGNKGTICLYTNTAAMTEFLPGKLAAWLTARPQWNIDLKERTSTEIIRAVTCGLAEAGIISDAIAAGSLQLHPIASDHLVLIVARHHPLATSRKINFADITSEPFIGLAAGSALQEHIGQHAARLGKQLNFRIRMNTFSSVCEMVSQGAGVAILPEKIARQYRKKYPHKQLDLTDNWARRQLCLCYRDWQTLSAPVRELLQHLGGSCSRS